MEHEIAGHAASVKMLNCRRKGARERPHTFTARSLEREASSELQDSGIVGIGDLTEGAAVDVRVRVLELRMVEKVEGIDAQLQIHAFGDLRRLRQRHVQIRLIRPAEMVAWQ